ncbi:carbohydrate ABC transporter permease [Blautia sp. OF03-15BH]|uniref:carbohydrate ABC transporter permease n=1 Tax=Blautia sp. OF03-15BH TaxID=2292287 RepID=UPI000E539725|nr:carbohydrate ABC transporter permease [Blautia sp. OF03-15BH]RGY02018.1 carbohydrate ABC transporter permease [Blautia sp. OF03-15BH]
MNRKKTSMGRKVFLAVDVIVILLLCLICMVPLLNLLAYSFSASQPIIENKVFLWPKEFTLKAYQYVLESKEFWSSVSVSVQRVLLGVPLNTLLTILVAYPLSKDERQFKARKYYVAYMLTVMLFNGGLMPTYYIVSKTKLIDTVWALIIPGAVPIFNCIVLMNFFRGIPSELEESAKLDGASQWQILWRIFIPISKPSLATIILFSLINHWNSWFDGLIYSNHTTNYPLQSYLQTLVTSTTEILAQGDVKAIAKLVDINDTNMKAAQIFISVIPLMLIYPFLQKYFTTGLTMGSVKG